MVAANADEYAGEASYKKVIDDAIAEGTRLQPVTADAACFVAGTLVHTKEGLVPIEQIRVGDWVLSQPEQKGERAYKRVVKTFSPPPPRNFTSPIRALPSSRRRRG